MAVARSNGWKFADIESEDFAVDAETLALLPAHEARAHNAIPLRSDDRRVLVAVPDPGDYHETTALRLLFGGRTVNLVYADPAAIRRKIEEVYSARGEAAVLAGSTPTEGPQGDFAGGDLGRVAGSGDSRQERLLRLVIEQALRDGASDVHIEPVRDGIEVRERVDGSLRPLGDFRQASRTELVNLIRVRASMTHSNAMTTASGVLGYTYDGERVDIRVETTPTVWGTGVVMRLQSNVWRDINTLGFSDYNLARFRSAIAQPHGMVLLTGPVGSGKTTTQYSALREKVSDKTKIITLEDPVEYKAPRGLTQIPINVEQGLTFDSGMRSIVRQDPDVVLLGEMRDTKTALTAVDAAMVGGLLLSTVHANDAISTVPRVGRLGVDLGLLADTLLCVVSQRLAARLCEECKVPRRPTEEHLAEHGFTAVSGLPEHIYEANPSGCDACTEGYAGRLPIHEVMLVDDALADAIGDGARRHTLLDLARTSGMRTMREDGFDKVVRGLISLEQVNAHTRRTWT